ncbi:sensor histidine kinase [Georgenia satyanarayanai]|uniref:sensor histidine kinase n=1 Tax=Georgenia satyanarayanai TaxID=860221 RepID=UPI000DA22BEF|nr:histidine kinase [Georgenia satyanarayanai]
MTADRARARVDRARRTLAERPDLADRAVWLGYLAAVLVMTAVYLVPSVIWYPHPPGSRGALTLAAVPAAAGLLGALALRRRRRHPARTVVATAALAALSLALVGAPGATVLGAALAVYSLAATWPSVRTWPAVIGAVAAVSGATLFGLSLHLWAVVIGLSNLTAGAPDYPPGPLLPHEWTGMGRALLTSHDNRVLEATLYALLLVSAVVVGLNVRSRRQREAAARAQVQARLREHRQDLLMARSTERTTIAREVHDVVAHSISVMVALADGAGAVASRSPDRALEAMREVSATGRSALADMRRVLAALDETAPDPAEETADLTAMVDRFRAAGLPVAATGLDVDVPGPVALAMRRIVGEALTNALRHAPGTPRVVLTVLRTGDAVEIEVLDDGSRGGVPEAPTQGSGRGLVGIRERAAILGGRAEAGPRPGGGWRVAVTLPVDGGQR